MKLGPSGLGSGRKQEAITGYREWMQARSRCEWLRGKGSATLSASSTRPTSGPPWRSSARKPRDQSVDGNSAVHEMVMLHALWRFNGQKQLS